MTDSFLLSRTEIPTLSKSFDTFRIHGQSHVGSVRRENQDYFGFEQTGEYALLVVLDGMGGHSGGFEASRIACKEILKYFTETCSSAADIDPKQFLNDAIQQGHEAILRFVEKNRHMEGMGTTVVTAFIHKETCWIAHVGDSRAHILRGDELIQLTVDHTCVHQLARTGDLSLEDMAKHPMRHILDRSMGSEEPLVVEVREEPILLSKGDRILLSSDGFLQYVEDQDILDFLALEQISSTAHKCIETSLKRGGSDNITVGIFEFTKEIFMEDLIEDARIAFYEEVQKAQRLALEKKAHKEDSEITSIIENKKDSLRIEYTHDGEYDLPPPPEASKTLQYVLFAFIMMGIGIVLGTFFTNQ